MKVLLILWMLAGFASAAPYYVDFDGGSDAAAGTSTGAAWKHCPGDPSATGTAASHTPTAGNTYNFKGGVVYRGGVDITTSGSSGNPITYQGEPAGWGTGKAIMEGALVVSTSWTQCASSGDCKGNANFANIYWTTIPAGVTNAVDRPFFWNGVDVRFAQAPVTTSLTYWSKHSEIYTLPQSAFTQTTITDATRFTSSDSAYYADCYVTTWVIGNQDATFPITSFNTATDTITFTNTGNTPYTDRDGFYTILGRVGDMSQANMWSLSTAENRIYFWAPGGVDPDTGIVSYGSEKFAFRATGPSYITVDGFAIRGYCELFTDGGNTGGLAVSAGSSGVQTNIIASDLSITSLRALAGTPVINFGAALGADFTATGNTIHDCLGNRGIQMSYMDNATAANNTIYNMDGTAIWLTGTTGGTISGNYIYDCNGAHGNGISVYTGASDVNVFNNRLRNCATAITAQTSSNLMFYNNLVDADGGEGNIQCGGGDTGYVRWFNNTLVNFTGAVMLVVETDDATATLDIRNNIIHCGGNLDPLLRSNNIYINRSQAPWQNSGDGWNLSTNESDSTVGALFTNAAAGDWTLKAGSPAIGTGVNLSATFTTDLAGATRSTWDIGAYAYGASPPPGGSGGNWTGTGITTTTLTASP